MAAIVRNEDHYDYAIVGGGCFGASSALGLIREWPDARIIWFEGTHTHTASQDESKIIRAAYEDDDYVAFLEETLEMWRTDPLYKEYYHQTGWVQVVGKDNHANTVKGPNDRMISVEEMQQMVGSQDKPKLEAGEELRFNENIGYADFNLAVEAVAKEASMLGVRREKKDATRLFVSKGVCWGVEAGDYSIVVKKETVVTAGSWTPKLLEKSKVEFPSDFFIISAVGVATMPLKEKEFEELKSMPIIVTKGGEVIPSRKHKVLKMTITNTFRIQHPDELKDLESFDVGKNRAVLEKMLPQFAGRQLNWWICPELMTPYQHPLVDRVPGILQLTLAVGGSYHCGKLLPKMGGMVVRRHRGETDLDTLEGRLLKRWGWDRSTEKVAIHRSVIPKDN